MADLSELFQVAPMSAGYNLGGILSDQRQARGLDRQGKSLENAQLQQTLGLNEQMNPLKVQHQQAVNQGLSFDNEGKALGNKKTAGTLDSDIGATNSENKSKITKAHIEQASRLFSVAEQAAMRGGDNPMIRSFIFQQNGFDVNDPSVQQMLRASPQDIMAGAKAVKQHELDFNASYQGTLYTANKHLEGQKGNNAATVRAAEIGADARIKSATSRNTGGADFWTNFYKTRSTVDKYGLLNAEASKLEQMGESDEAAKLRRMATEIKPQAEAEINARNAGKVDPSATTGGAVQNVPPANIAPPGPAQPQPGPQNHSLADVQRQYPGIPPDKLREAYKRKFGVDLK